MWDEEKKLNNRLFYKILKRVENSFIRVIVDNDNREILDKFFSTTVQNFLASTGRGARNSTSLKGRRFVTRVKKQE